MAAATGAVGVVEGLGPQGAEDGFAAVWLGVAAVGTVVGAIGDWQRERECLRRRSQAVARRFYVSSGFRELAHGFEPEWQLADVEYGWSR